MKQLSVSEAAQLVKKKSGPAISLYLSTDVSEKDDTVKLRSKLERLYKTVESVVSRCYDSVTRDRLLGPLRKALDFVGLSRKRGGIGIYHNKNITGFVRLQTVKSDLAVASDSFHLKPVFRCIQSQREYLLLALGTHNAKLFSIVAEKYDVVDVVKYRDLVAQNSQPELRTPNVKVYGQRIRQKRNLKDVFCLVRDRMRHHWLERRLPLMIAAPQASQDMFRAVCIYSGMVEQGIDAYVEDLEIEKIIGISQNMMEVVFDEMDYKSVIEFRHAYSKGLATTSLEKIARAAARGQVQKVLVAEDQYFWGNLDRDTGKVYPLEHPGMETSDDVLDDIAELVVNKGGTVTVLPTKSMPSNVMIAALLRWDDRVPAYDFYAAADNTMKPERVDAL